MTQDDAFLRAIIESPNDEGLRLIYADFLEERGDPRAQLIRVLVALAHLPARHPRRPELAARERDILQRHTGSWLRECLNRFLKGLNPAGPFDQELRRFAEEQQALPLWKDIGGCYALNSHGEIVSFPWDNPEEAGLEDDARIRNAVLFYGGGKFPEVRLLLPPRPLSSRECPSCQGTGVYRIPGIICGCGGLGWFP